jgi:outer membrane protein TolC
MIGSITRLAIAGLLVAAPAIAQSAPAAATADAPLTLQAVLEQARLNSQQFRAAQLASDLAIEDKKQAKAALLPSISGFSQYIYTQANGTPSGVWVPNDGPNIYAMWLNVHGDIFSWAKWSEYKSAGAAQAVARAKADVAARGLVSTIVQNYYGLVAAQRKATSAEEGLREARQFLDITIKEEAGGEVAHSDVIKAQIQVSQRNRDAQDAELAVLKSRLALSVLIFPDFRDNFSVVDDLATLTPLLPLVEIRAGAVGNSPDLRAAEASVQQESLGVGVARGGVLPSVSFDYWYGINANDFATYDPEGHRLLGSVAQVSLNVPLWNWGAAQSKLKQAELRVQVAKNDLSVAQRQLQANLSTFHREAEIALAQVASLRESLDLSTESLRLTLLRYQAGEVSVLEVVDAQNTLITARNAYDDGLVRYRVALAALQTLTGIL